MKLLKTNLLLLACILMTSSVFGQVSGEQGVDLKNTGQSTMNFLQVSVVPKAIAMGDAYSAIGTGVESMFYNPAGLAEMNNKVDVVILDKDVVKSSDFVKDRVRLFVDMATNTVAAIPTRG